MTKRIKVKIRTVDMIKNFVSLNGKSPCNTRLYVTPDMYVSGDSIMGVFSINLLEPLTVLISSDKEENILKLLDNYRQNDIVFMEMEGDRK